MKKRRNTVCKVRLNESELQLFEEKSRSYGDNISAMVRDAVSRIDEKKAMGRIEHLSEMLAFYKEYQQRLSWLGGNFNQAMHRANELAIAGRLSVDYFNTTLMPKFREAVQLVRSMKTCIDNIHDKIESQ